MKTPHHVRAAARKRNHERGFTLTEVLMAIAILLIGIISVAQLVPVSVGSNSTNRNDSSALVFVQREIDQFLSQPLNMSLSPPAFIDAEGHSCNLGDPTHSNALVGNATAIFYNQVIINFNGSAQAGYSFTYHDPNDPYGVVYDVRWAVISVTNSNGMVTSKRFIMGARKLGGNGIYNPVTLDTILAK